jgi:hypothetical protein
MATVEMALTSPDSMAEIWSVDSDLSAPLLSEPIWLDVSCAMSSVDRPCTWPVDSDETWPVLSAWIWLVVSAAIWSDLKPASAEVVMARRSSV